MACPENEFDGDALVYGINLIGIWVLTDCSNEFIWLQWSNGARYPLKDSLHDIPSCIRLGLNPCVDLIVCFLEAFGQFSQIFSNVFLDWRELLDSVELQCYPLEPTPKVISEPNFVVS